MSVMLSSSQPSSLRGDPMVIDRQSTDKSFIAIFLFVVFIWLVTVILAFDTEEGTEPLDRLSGLLNEYLIYLTELLEVFHYYDRLSLFQLLKNFAALSLVISWLWLRIIKQFTMFFIYAGMLMHVICTFAWVHHVQVSLSPTYTFQEKEITAALIVIILRTISMAAGMISLYETGINLPAKIIWKIFRPYSIILFTWPLIIHGCMLMIQKIVLIFMIRSMYAESFSDNIISYKLFAFTIIVFCGFIVMDFCFKFSLMVFSYYTTNFCWVGYRVFETKRYIDLSINHLGTMMFSSMGPISWSCALFQAFKHKPSWERKENYLLYIISKIFLTMSMPINALIFSSIYGTDFVKSTQLAFDTIIEGILSLGCVINHLIQIIIVEYWSEMKEDYEEIMEEAGLLDMTIDHDDFPVELGSFENAAAPYCDNYLSLIYICARTVLINQIISLNEES